MRLLEAIGIQAGIAVQKARLFEAAERRAKEQEALKVIATATSQSLDLQELFEIAADKTVMVTERQRINFRLKDAAYRRGRTRRSSRVYGGRNNRASSHDAAPDERRGFRIGRAIGHQ